MVWNGLTVAVAAGRRVLAGDERHVLADDDARLLVVERQERRRRQDVGVALRLERAREEGRDCVIDAEPGDVDRAADDAEVEARARARRGSPATSMMLLPLPRAPKLVPPKPCASASSCRRPVSACHWMPNSAALSAVDLDDQRLDEHLRAAHVELLDHRAQVVVDRLGRHDDQRVVRGVGLNRRAAGAERRRAPAAAVVNGSAASRSARRRRPRRRRGRRR